MSAGPPCGNNPNYRVSDADRAVVDSFKAYLARRAAEADDVPDEPGPNEDAPEHYYQGNDGDWLGYGR